MGERWTLKGDLRGVPQAVNGTSALPWRSTVEVMPVSEHEEAMVKIHDALLRGHHPTLTPVSRSLAVGAADAFVQRIQEREAELDAAVEAMKDLCYALFRSNIDWAREARECGDEECCGDCRYLRDVRRLVREWDGGILADPAGQESGDD